MIEVSILDFNPESSLKFFSYQSPMDFDRGFPVTYVNNIFWTDKYLPTGKVFGPFNNLYDALQHFKWVKQNRGPSDGTGVIPTDNVIYVDFKSKKRL